MKSKKGSFDTINNLMIAFVGFIVLIIAITLIISTLVKSSVVCSAYEPNITVQYAQNRSMCIMCPYNGTTPASYNVTDNICYNSTGNNAWLGGAAKEYNGTAYEGTKDLRDAAMLPPQFANLIMIVAIIVGILAFIGVLGYTIYGKMKQ